MRGRYEEDKSPLKLLGIAKLMNKRVFKSEMERTDFNESNLWKIKVIII